MSNRSQLALRTSLSRLAVAGAATLASVFTLAPAAVADEDATTAQPPEVVEQTPPAPADDAAPAEEPIEERAEEASASDPIPVEPAAKQAESSVMKSPAAAVAAEVTYSPQTFRVGARIATGAYSPGGTTAGSMFTIYYTDASGIETNETCTASGTPDIDGIVYCPTTFTAAAGVNVVVNQTAAPDGLILDSQARGLNPCELSEFAPCPSEDLIFTATGIVPKANRDKASTDANTSVIVDVLANDQAPDAATTVTLSPASSGTATVVTLDGRQQIEYTPNSGVTDTIDRFSYTLTNPNGSSIAALTIAIGDVAPNYGTQKYYVGVQIADGSYAPDATTLAGSEFEITTTALDGTESTVTCVTIPNFCDGDISLYNNSFEAPAGSTVTVVQTKAAPGLTPSTETMTLPPCDTDATDCDDVDLVFTNTGPLPGTTGDEATTREGEPVTIDVLGNDDSADPDTTLAVATSPSHGTAVVVGTAAPSVSRAARIVASAVPAAGTLAIRYTPAAGFFGTDTFTYAVTNSNGTRIETVTISVLEGPPDAVDPADDADGDEADDNAVLPDTGGADPRLFGLAALLVASGGVLTAAGRRRRPSVHSG